jgi:hypothetical protein
MTQLTKCYVAIPYSVHEEYSFHCANKVTADLINRGYNAFSPITHSHPIAHLLNCKPTWDDWKYIDFQYIDWADELVVVVMKHNGINKIKNSVGVMSEVEYCINNNKPIYIYLEQFNELIKLNNHLLLNLNMFLTASKLTAAREMIKRPALESVKNILKSFEN